MSIIPQQQYSIYPITDKKTGKVSYFFKYENQKSLTNKEFAGAISYGIPMLFDGERKNFYKMYNAEDAITFVNFLNSDTNSKIKEAILEPND